MPQRPLDPRARSRILSVRLAPADLDALGVLRAAWGCGSDGEAIRRALRLAAAGADPGHADRWRWAADRARP